jgi:ELWxxDGT repeat protein
MSVNGTLFFPARDGDNGVELWESDGTADGTALVRNINPVGSSSPTGLIAVGTTVFFAADDSDHGVELWATRALDDVRPCADNASELCVHGSAVFTAEGRDIRILAEAASAEVTVRGNENNVTIEDGFTGRLTVLGDQTDVNGSDGNDDITTVGCDNSVKSRAGDDTVLGDNDADCSGSTIVVRAGKGDDFIKSEGTDLAILRGERDEDHLVGGDGDDRLYGGTYDDWIRANKGNDEVRGGRDNDVIRGGQGEDILRGRAGEDVVRGDRGRDAVHGNTGDDRVVGNRGPDRLRGGKNDDTLFGGKGPDFIDGGLNTDTCSGDRGDDVTRDCEG